MIAQGGSAKVRTIGAGCEMLEPRRLLSFTPFPLPSGANAFGISGMAGGADGDIWLTNDTPPQIIRISPGGSSKTFNLPKSAQPARITNGPDGNMWFIDSASNKVDRITSSGQITPFAIPKFSGHAVLPVDLTAGPDGNFWITEYDQVSSTPLISRMTPTGVFTNFPLPDKSLEIGVISPGPDGNLWFSAGVPFGPVDLGRITPAGKISLFPYKIDTQGNFFLRDSLINSIVTGPDHKLWVMAGIQIDQMNNDGTVAAHYLSPAPSSNGSFPARLSNLTVGSDGNFWLVVGESSNQIERMTPKGVFSDVTVPGGLPWAFPFNGPPNFGEQVGPMVAGGDGNLWYLETKPQIVRFDFHNSILAASEYVDTSSGAPLTNIVSKFIDTGPAKPASAYKATITFDDGTTAAGTIASDGKGGFNVTLTQNWPSGQSTPTITISDAKSPARTANASDFVTAVPLQPKGASIAVTATAGKIFTANLADFTNVDLTSLNQYFVNIDWGDGQQSDGDLIPDGKGGVLVSSSHGYAAPGTYNITVDLTPPDVQPRIFGSGPPFPLSGEVISKATVAAGVMSGIGNTLLAQAHHPVKQTEAYFKLSGSSADLSHYHATLEWADLFTNAQHPTLAMTILPRSGGMFAVQAPVTFDGQGVAYYRVVINDDRVGMDDASVVGIAYGQILVDYPPTGSSFGVFLPTAHVQGATTNVEDDGSGFEDDFNPTLTEIVKPFGKTLFGKVGQLFSGDVGTIAGVIPNAKNLADLHATIEWGDGTTSAATFSRDAKGIIHVRGSHTYAKPGKYAIAVRCTQTIYKDGAPESNMPDIRLTSIFSFIHIGR